MSDSDKKFLVSYQMGLIRKHKMLLETLKDPKSVQELTVILKASSAELRESLHHLVAAGLTAKGNVGRAHFFCTNADVLKKFIAGKQVKGPDAEFLRNKHMLAIKNLEEPMTTKEVMKKTNGNYATTHVTLKKLEEAGIIYSLKMGRQVFYCTDKDRLDHLLDAGRPSCQATP